MNLPFRRSLNQGIAVLFWLAWLIALYAHASENHDHPQHDHARQPAASSSHHQHAGGEEGHEEHGAPITTATAEALGIRLATAGPAELRETLPLHGRIVPASGGRVQVGAPFAGIVQTVHVEEGASVAKGDPLAAVRNSESLQVYTVKAPRSGVVAVRSTDPGAAVRDEPLFTLLDQGQVRAEVAAFPADLRRLQSGQPARISAIFEQHVADAAVDYIAPVVTVGQATPVRITLDNADNKWRVGQAVQADIEVTRAEVPIAVIAKAVQTMDGKPVVFVREGSAFEARDVQLGRRDAAFVEVLAGLKPGERYVTDNSFLIKADILKSGATHAH